MDLTHVAPQLVLTVGSAVVLVVALSLPRRWQWMCAVLTLMTLAAAGGATIVLLRELPTIGMDGAWAVDAGGLTAQLIILAAAAVTVGLSPEWFASDHRHGEYYTLLLFATLGATLMAGAADLMELVVAVLLTSVAGYTVAAFHRRSALAVEAGMKFFLLGGLTNPLLLLGAVVLFALTGATGYVEVQAAFLGGAGDQVALVAAVMLLVVGVAFELGAVPAHAWMPDVAEGAPLPSAAFLTVAPKVGAVVALGRVLTLLPGDLVGWRPLVAAVAAATMTLGNLAALWQDDLRRLLGWSSVSQSGYALMGVVALGLSDVALPATVLFVAGYAAANLAAFGVVTELRGRTAIDRYGGLGAARPWLALILTVALLSLVGIPPLVGFAGKWTLFAATVEAGYGWLAVLAVVNTVVSLFYYLRVIGPMYLGEATEPVPVLGRWALTATAVAGALVVALGLLPDVILRVVEGTTLLP